MSSYYNSCRGNMAMIHFFFFFEKGAQTKNPKYEKKNHRGSSVKTNQSMYYPVCGHILEV